MIGMSLCMLTDEGFESAFRLFQELQRTFPLHSCEIHTETALYPAAWKIWDQSQSEYVKLLRQSLKSLGVHLPFFEINPASNDPETARSGQSILQRTIDAAYQVGADYVVMHVNAPGLTGEMSPSAIQAWSDIISPLANRAKKLGVIFCLENADGLRMPVQVAEMANKLDIKVCLDIGHLFERVYECKTMSLPTKLLIKAIDRFSPHPFLFKKQLPVAGVNTLQEVLSILEGKVYCVHLHNHNGRIAHQPLHKGKIPWMPFQQHLGIPLVLEADYRLHGMTAAHRDLQTLAKMPQ